MLTSFDHLTILVHDLDAAVERYTQLFAHTPVWRGAHPELGTQGALFGLSNALVELAAPLASAPETDGMRELLAARGEGLHAIAFGTDDAASFSAALRKSGVRATEPQDGEARDADGKVRSYRTIDLSPRITRGLSAYIVERGDRVALRPTISDRSAAFALDHVVIRTSDVEAAIALYRDKLGIRLALDTKLGTARMLFFRIGGVTLEVVEDHGVGDQDKLYGATYRVRDLDRAHARMKSAGFAINDVRAGMKPATQVFSVKDGTCNVPTLILRDEGRDGA